MTAYGREVSTFDSRDRSLGAYEALLRRDLVESRGLNPRPDLDDDHFYVAAEPWPPSRGWSEGAGQPETNARLATFGKPVGPKFTAAGYAPFDDPEKMRPAKWLTRKKVRGFWPFDDPRWDGLLTAPCQRAAAGRPRGDDLQHWWHCQQCRGRVLLPRLAQIEDKATWTKPEMGAIDDVFIILECQFRGLNREAGYRWQKFADKWETPCRLCSGVRRGGHWVNREDAHRSCWNELQRRQRRNRYVAIKSRSEATNNSTVVLIGHNCSRGTEPSVRAVNGSAPVPVFVSPHPQPLSSRK